ncbi:MAG: phosphate-starvation-inducible PsiE family protein [Cyanobium sp.]
MRGSVVGALRRFFADHAVLRAVDRGERVLARVLGLVLLLVLAVAATQLLWQIGLDLINPAHSWMGDSLIVLLGDLLNLLIGLEVLQNISAYLRRGVVQIDLVLLTAITAVGRKVIVLPPGAENKPQLLMGLGVAVLCLAAAYWLVRAARPPLSMDTRREQARSSQAPHP